jgi:hypothetical protein
VIYPCSKLRHRGLWRALRAAGAPIQAGWIDSPPEATAGMIWDENERDIAHSTVLLAYFHPTDPQPLRSPLYEVGLARGRLVPVVVVGADDASHWASKGIARESTLEAALLRHVPTAGARTRDGLREIIRRHERNLQHPCPYKCPSPCDCIARTLARVARESPDSVRLVAQLLGVPACPTCDFLESGCRCPKPSKENP